MYRSNHILPSVVIPILAVVAIIGYLAGSHRAPATPGAISVTHTAQATHVASVATVLLEYPDSWQRVTSAPQLPGVAILHPFLLAPGGDASKAGLLSGQLAGDEPSPLPHSLLAMLHGVPHTEVVSLANAQAYRYSQLSIPGFADEVNIYVVPNLGSDDTMIACYAANGYAAYLHECEEIATRLTLVGQAAAALSPNTTYASALGAVLTKLDSDREQLRTEIHARTQYAGLAPLATALATRFGDTAAALHALEPPLAAVGAQTALAAAVVQARDAYETLASAAASESPEEYAAAERGVETAEAAVNAALENFQLLGYGRS